MTDSSEPEIKWSIAKERSEIVVRIEGFEEWRWQYLTYQYSIDKLNEYWANGIKGSTTNSPAFEKMKAKLLELHHAEMWNVPQEDPDPEPVSKVRGKKKVEGPKDIEHESLRDPVIREAVVWLRSDGLLHRLLEVIEQRDAISGYLVGETENAAQLLLECVERISAIVEGASSSGKNTLVDAMIRVLPDNHVKKITGMTPKALRWLPEGTAYPVLYLAEMESLATGEERTSDYDMKLMISEKGLTIFYPEKGENGKMETRERTVSVDQFIITTAEVNLPPQLENRLEKHHAKDSQVQTARVRDTQLWKATMLRGKDYSHEMKVAKAAMGIVLANTKEMKVVIPYAQALKSILTDERTTTRRQTPRLLRLITASAKLHYLARLKIEVAGQTCIIATPLDLAIVLGVCGENLEQELGSIDAKMRLVLEVCRKVDPITVPGVTKRAHIDKISELSAPSTVGDLFRALREKGALTAMVEEDGKEKKAYHGAKVYELTDASSDYLTLDHSELLRSAWSETSKWHERNAHEFGIIVPLEEMLGSIDSEQYLVPISNADTTIVPPAPIGTNLNSDSMLPDDARRDT